jgi:hypothetical protein
VQARHHGIIDGRDGDVRVCASVGPVGEVVAVWTTAASLQAVTARTISAGGASYGWGQAGTQEPIGAYGVVRFSPGLEPAWHYPRYTEVGPWDAISDCYALNVDDSCTWACYYTDFPVVRIREGTVTGWHNDIKGARALALSWAAI